MAKEVFVSFYFIIYFVLCTLFINKQQNEQHNIHVKNTKFIKLQKKLSRIRKYLFFNNI